MLTGSVWRVVLRREVVDPGAQGFHLADGEALLDGGNPGGVVEVVEEASPAVDVAVLVWEDGLVGHEDGPRVVGILPCVVVVAGRARGGKADDEKEQGFRNGKKS